MNAVTHQTFRHRFQESDALMLIDGAWVAASSGRTFDVFDPATENLLARVAAADATDVDRAVRAAQRAFEGEWASFTPMARERLLHRLADLVEANAEELAQLETLNNGKPLTQARTRDLPATVNRLRYMAGWASKLEGRTLRPSLQVPDAEFLAYTVREPVGVVGQIVPWNFPLMMAVGKLAPALAAGCTCVLKPAEQTPLTALRLGELIVEAGFPKGVVNIVTGLGETAGAALVAHPLIKKIAFTGSTAVGKLIGQRAMTDLKRVSLELGGKSPVIIGPDADLDAAIRGAAQAIFYNQGQVCIAGSRLYVAAPIYQRVLDGVADIARSMRLGPGLDPNTQLGPLVSKEQMQRVLGYIEKGRSDGGRVLAGGSRLESQGYFVQPTVFADLPANSACMREEIFGPVLAASAYRSVDDIAAIANDTPFGLAASIWTRDISFAHRLAKRIQAGTVWINCHGLLDPTMPFGGYKQSGIGRENGADGVELYTERKTVLVKL